MEYHTLIYLFAFLPTVLLLYGLMPRKTRPIILLAASFVFFWSISGWLVVFLIGTSLLTHAVAVRIGTLKKEGKKTAKACKRILVMGIVVLLGVLGFLKYYNFFAKNVNALSSLLGAGALAPHLRLFLPIGISFYTLEAISLMTDVYWGLMEPPKNVLRTVLFLGYFPKLMEGPISRYTDLGDSLWEGEPVRWENLTEGSMRILWGLFKKLVIADRIDPLVGNIFADYPSYHGAMIAVAAIAYTVQLYMEFSGVIDIVIGSSKLFGISLKENFRQPFLAKNASEFWRRWHISLGTWFKTYVFYPVSLSKTVRKWNRFGRKKLNKYMTRLGAVVLTLFPVWMCNGLWHGAEWNYIFFGIYYFVILTAESALEPVSEGFVKKCGIREDAFGWKMLRTLKTWIIIFAGELIFRAEGFRASLRMLPSLFRGFSLRVLTDGSLLTLGIDRADWIVIICGVAVVAVKDYLTEKKMLPEGWGKLPAAVRWAAVYGLILAVVLFGAYGFGYQSVDLIYAGF